MPLNMIMVIYNWLKKRHELVVLNKCGKRRI